MTDQEILDQMTNMGKSVGNVLDACGSAEAMLTGLMANSAEIPKEMLDQLNKSLGEVRKGKADMKEGLKGMEKIFSQNGNSSSK